MRAEAITYMYLFLYLKFKPKMKGNILQKNIFRMCFSCLYHLLFLFTNP